MVVNPKELAVKELLARQKAEDSFYEFVKQAWPIIEGDNPFVEGWCLAAICEHVQAVVERKIRFLNVNCPPRLAKSTLVSVMLCAWTWLRAPNERFLYSSYSHNLSMRDSVRCRRVIQSDFYQRRWADRFTIIEDQNTKIRYDNDKGGFRMSVSQNSSTTGEGGSILVCLPYETKIETDHGDFAIGFIVDRQLDVSIHSYNHKKNFIELKSIEAYEKNPGRQLVEIDLGDRIIECTEDHQIFTKNRGYVQAKHLTPEDVVFLLSS